MYFSGKMIFAEKLTGKQKNWIYFLALFFTSRFYLQNFDEGQVNFLMMTTILLGLYAEKHNKSFLAGMLLGFSILVKYMGVVFIPYFLIKRRFKVVLFIVLALIIYGLVPALFWGWERNSFLQSQYIPFLCKTSLDMSSLSDYVNQSLMSMLIRLFSSHGNYGINLVSLKDYQLGFLTGCLYVFIYSLTIYPAKCYEKEKNGRQLNNIDLALLFACAALFNPNAWMHAFIFLTFGYMVIFAYLFKTSFQDRYVLTLLLLSFVFHSFTNSTITQYWNRDIFDVFSFVTIGALFALLALLKIKFSPKENYP
jgi:hypothetical protein